MREQRQPSRSNLDLASMGKAPLWLALGGASAARPDRPERVTLQPCSRPRFGTSSVPGGTLPMRWWAPGRPVCGVHGHRRPPGPDVDRSCVGSAGGPLRCTVARPALSDARHRAVGAGRAPTDARGAGGRHRHGHGCGRAAQIMGTGATAPGAVVFAATHPDRVDGLVLLCPFLSGPLADDLT